MIGELLSEVGSRVSHGLVLAWFESSSLRWLKMLPLPSISCRTAVIPVSCEPSTSMMVPPSGPVMATGAPPRMKVTKAREMSVDTSRSTAGASFTATTSKVVTAIMFGRSLSMMVNVMVRPDLGVGSSTWELPYLRSSRSDCRLLMVPLS